MKTLQIVAVWLFLAMKPAPEAPTLAERLCAAADEQAVAAILDENPGAVSEDLFGACRKAAQGYLDKYRQPEALRGFTAALAVARRLRSVDDTAISLRGIAIAHSRMDHATLALSSFEEALRAATEAGDKPLQCDIWRGLGTVHRRLAKLPEAIADDERSVALARELGDVHRTAAGLSNLSTNYSQSGDLRRAAEIIAEALRVGRDFPDIVETTTGNLGTIAMRQGNPDAGKYYLEQTLERADQNGDKQGSIIHLLNLGPVYHALGELNKALVGLTRAAAL
ncbi:MAG: tetratricopeptide repeat protein, partial [Acidobacteriota bacterium]